MLLTTTDYQQVSSSTPESGQKSSFLQEVLNKNREYGSFGGVSRPYLGDVKP